MKIRNKALMGTLAALAALTLTMGAASATVVGGTINSATFNIVNGSSSVTFTVPSTTTSPCTEPTPTISVDVPSTSPGTTSLVDLDALSDVQVSGSWYQLHITDSTIFGSNTGTLSGSSSPYTVTSQKVGLQVDVSTLNTTTCVATPMCSMYLQLNLSGSFATANLGTGAGSLTLDGSTDPNGQNIIQDGFCNGAISAFDGGSVTIPNTGQLKADLS